MIHAQLIQDPVATMACQTSRVFHCFEWEAHRCLVLCCLVLSCAVLFCSVSSCLVVSWRVLSCLGLSWACVVLACLAVSCCAPIRFVYQSAVLIIFLFARVFVCCLFRLFVRSLICLFPTDDGTRYLVGGRRAVRLRNMRAKENPLHLHRNMTNAL